MRAGHFLFLGLLGLCPVLGMFVAYCQAYGQRMKGLSGHKLEAILARTGFLVTFVLAFGCFWGWPENEVAWFTLPGMELISDQFLTEDPLSHPDYTTFKLLLAVGIAAGLAVTARLSAFHLNRRLVKQVPRFMRPEDVIKKPTRT